MPVLNYAEAEALRARLEPRIRDLKTGFNQLKSLAAQMEALKNKAALVGGYDAWPEMARILKLWNKCKNDLKNDIAHLEHEGVIVRDLETGLVDIPGRLEKLPIYWCWRLEEPVIMYYHGREEGFAGRKPVPREIRLPAKRSPE